MLLNKEDCNVISVDWHSGHALAYDAYKIGVRNVPYAGKEVAEMISFLIENSKIKYDNIHLIGFSLGAHVAGFTGKHHKGAIPRITGNMFVFFISLYINLFVSFVFFFTYFYAILWRFVTYCDKLYKSESEYMKASEPKWGNPY